MESKIVDADSYKKILLTPGAHLETSPVYVALPSISALCFLCLFHHHIPKHAGITNAQ